MNVSVQKVLLTRISQIAPFLIALLLLFVFLCQARPAHAGVSVDINIGSSRNRGRVTVKKDPPARRQRLLRPSHKHKPIKVDYSFVRPRTATVVYRLPLYFSPIWVNGILYYTDNYTFYVHTGHAYQAVPAPTTIIQGAPLIVAQTSPAPVPVSVSAVPPQGIASENSLYTVNIPNQTGGYTVVKITRSNDGFIGPQGEYYEQFPGVDQLRVMYAR